MVVAAVLGLAVAAGAVQPVRAAHDSSLAQRAAGASLVLSSGRRPEQTARSASRGRPPVNLADYRLCLRPSSYGAPPTPVSAYLTGYSDARKLGGALPVGFPRPAFARSVGSSEGLQIGEPTFRGHLFTCSLIRLELDQGGQRQLPPLRATLLGFGFTPVTATAVLTQVGRDPLTTVVYVDEGPEAVQVQTAPATVVAVARLGVRLTNVRVNGVALDVRPSCRAAGPLFTPGNPVAPGALMLTGGTYPGDPVPGFGGAVQGGALSGQADIPPFTGCVTPTGENLDALLTASLSGPGNFVQEVVGPLCIPSFGSGCNSANLPADAPLWTVARGGRYTASGSLTFSMTTSSSLTITCARSRIAGVLPDATGPLHGGLATVRWLRIAGCSGDDGSSWSVTQQGTAFLGPHSFAARITDGNVDDMVFGLTGTGTGAPGACHALLAGFEHATYRNRGSVLSLVGDATTVLVTRSTCPDLPPIFSVGPGVGSGTAAATYPLRPGGYRVVSP